MSMSDASLKIDGDLRTALHEVLERLDGAEGEVILDFSSVHRIEPGALRVLEVIAGKAADKRIPVVLGGVSVAVYKVLKLAKLAPRFSFRN